MAFKNIPRGVQHARDEPAGRHGALSPVAAETNRSLRVLFGVGCEAYASKAVQCR